MHTDAPLILYVKRNCLDDGPGIRTTIFFKGCPLSCVWCHNPESRKRDAEISHDGDACLACRACAKACPLNAVGPNVSGFVDRTRCDLCFACVEACPSEALRRMGAPMTVAEIMAIVEKDIPFFRTSGGGVTLSGGEPMLFMDFASILLRACRERGVGTLVETCGTFDFARFEEMILPFADEIYFDLKIFDPLRHREFCGADNQTILGNFRRLAELAKSGAFLLQPRIPLIPGLTDTDENLSGLSSFLRECGHERATLLPYNPTWFKKAAMLGATPTFAETKRQSEEELTKCRSFFSNAEDRLRSL